MLSGRAQREKNWDNQKCNNIHITGVKGREEREQGTKNLFEEIMTKNGPAGHQGMNEH